MEGGDGSNGRWEMGIPVHLKQMGSDSREVLNGGMMESNEGWCGH